MIKFNQKTRQVFDFIRKKSGLIPYFLLAVVVYLAVWIRTRNIAGLRDITTGGWTLGPDLDPFLFLRYAKYIVENGSLFDLDMMRYVPLGFDVGVEFPLLHYSIAIFHKFASFFGSASVEQSAAIYPVFMFGLTVIAFFFFSRELLSQIFDRKKSGYMAAISSFFLSVIPSFVPRTIAGIPEKESAAFFFLFSAFYFVLLSWKNGGTRKGYLLSGIGAVFAGFMAITWGGFLYLSLIVSTSMMIMFFLNQLDKKRVISYTIFVFVTYSIPFLLFERFTLSAMFNNFDSAIVIFTLTVFWVDILLNKFGNRIPHHFKKNPRFISFVFGGLLLALSGALIFGVGFIFNNVSVIYYQLVRPATSRLIQTVAENRQPFFVEWAFNFGPVLGKIPLLLAFSFISSIIILSHSLKKTNLTINHRFAILGSWIIFFIAVVFTRYSPESLFNGSNFISKTLYFAGILLPIVVFAYVSLKSHKFGNSQPYANIPLATVFLLVFFSIALISARAFIRLVLVLVPIISILCGSIFVISVTKIKQSITEKNWLVFRNLFFAFIIIFMIFAGYVHYSNSASLAQGYVPSSYTQQWQKAMQWVRDNTPTNSVFGHWWDYGYWIQSIGERSTVLDGGNLLGYWNHLMGRYGLTETDFGKTLEFLYSHNVTHFLIDSTDIGKYSAYSTIGSDVTYDRRSWIPTLLRDNSQTTERKNTTLYIYSGGSLLDEDIKYNLNGTEIFLPEGKAYLAAVIITIDSSDSISDVSAVYYFQNRTYQIPLRYYWDEKTGLVDSGEGIFAGIFVYPRVILNNQGGGDIEQRGAILYLSQRTVMSNVARFYLFEENSNNFKLVHSEPDQFVEMLNAQQVINGDFVYLNEFRGPIRIWEVDYPSSIKFNSDFLKTDYPEEISYT